VAAIVTAAARFPWPSRMSDTMLVLVYLGARSLERSWSATLATLAYRRLCDRRDGR
jgi:tRNA isopentenyl-2-thiomethyl-A-37 hydroxylase MiaE